MFRTRRAWRVIAKNTGDKAAVIARKELTWQSIFFKRIPGLRRYAGSDGRKDEVILEGGLPIITSDGQHIGAVGMSGASSELDGTCAKAGIGAIAHLL